MEATAEAPRKTPEIRREGHSITVRKDDIPWLETPEYKVALVTMRHGSVEFLFGSAIQSKPLLDAARQRTRHPRRGVATHVRALLQHPRGWPGPGLEPV